MTVVINATGIDIDSAITRCDTEPESSLPSLRGSTAYYGKEREYHGERFITSTECDCTVIASLAMMLQTSQEHNIFTSCNYTSKQA